MMSSAVESPSVTIFSSDWKQKPIEGTPFTIDWILRALWKSEVAIDPADVVDVTTSNISGCTGFASQIMRIAFHLDGCADQVSVVLKIPGAELLKRAQEGKYDLVQVDYYNQEVRFYQHFASLLCAPLPRMFELVKWVPGGDIGAILMEDLSGTCSVQSVSEGLNLQQVLSVVDHLADMHNSFLRLPGSERKKFADEFPPPEGYIDYHVNVIVPKAVEVTRKYPDIFGNRLDKFLDILYDRNYHRYFAASVSEAFGLPRVPVHGDLWSNNILWKNCDPDKVGAFVDWQAFYVGNPAFDLSRILMLSASTTVRRAYADSIISHFYSRLDDPFFTKADLDRAYKETLPYQCAHMVFVVQLLEPRYIRPQVDEMLQRAKAVLDDIRDYEPMYKASK
ncbi:hypothetical protein QR680_013860 [Steinernema hermaphroditum]|uniref:CHK kinase-like domain-containing protein n=1 Tax=Steinernema hermaphroditum TaxID=289476 RepID=A0AA39I9J3_9BILA|nr:hypothetical protein QR680_013860 [Steinernema hermaphroditum]